MFRNTMAQGKGLGKNAKKGPKSEGSIKRKTGRTKKGLKKQVKPRKMDQIMSKEVQKMLTKSINKNIEEQCLSNAGKAGTSLKVVQPKEVEPKPVDKRQK